MWSQTILGPPQQLSYCLFMDAILNQIWRAIHLHINSLHFNSIYTSKHVRDIRAPRHQDAGKKAQLCPEEPQKWQTVQRECYTRDLTGFGNKSFCPKSPQSFMCSPDILHMQETRLQKKKLPINASKQLAIACRRSDSLQRSGPWA